MNRNSLFGGYPNDGVVKSKELYVNRVITKVIEGKVMAYVSKDHFPDWEEMSKTDSGQKDFFLNRLHDANVSLNIAEQQISDMNEVYPFIPEDFNFESETVSKKGNSIYCQKNSGVMISRVQDDMWLIGIGEGVRVRLTDSKTAYIVLRSIAVISDEEFEKDTIISTSDEKIEEVKNA